MFYLFLSLALYPLNIFPFYLPFIPFFSSVSFSVIFYFIPPLSFALYCFLFYTQPNSLSFQIGQKQEMKMQIYIFYIDLIKWQLPSATRSLLSFFLSIYRPIDQNTFYTMKDIYLFCNKF